MTVDPTDKFLVNRSGSSYHVEQQDLMAQLEDDDLLLVNRNSKSYKITGAEFKGSLSSSPVIQSVTLTEDDPDGDRFTSQDFTTTAVMLDNGNPASTKSIRGWVEGSLIETIETDVITDVSSDGSTNLRSAATRTSPNSSLVTTLNRILQTSLQTTTGQVMHKGKLTVAPPRLTRCLTTMSIQDIHQRMERLQLLIFQMPLQAVN